MEGKELMDPGGCDKCRYHKPGVTIGTQTIFTWVQEVMGKIEESLEQIDAHVESGTNRRTDATGETERKDVKDVDKERAGDVSEENETEAVDVSDEKEKEAGDVSDEKETEDGDVSEEIIRDLIDETISEASSRSRHSSLKLSEVDERDADDDSLVLALSDSQAETEEECENIKKDSKVPIKKRGRKAKHVKNNTSLDMKINANKTVTVKTMKQTKTKEEEKTKENQDEKSSIDKTSAFYTNPHSLCVHLSAQGHLQKLMVGIEMSPKLKQFVKDKEEEVMKDMGKTLQKPASDADEEMTWVQGDATVPVGWLFTEHYIEGGRQVRSFRSPGGEVFHSRDEVAEWLEGQGTTLVVPTGLPVPEADESLCTGHCEGSCPILALGKELFKKNDYNIKRKKARIQNKDPESKVRNKVQEARDPKYLKGPGLCYGGAIFKAERPRLICVKENGGKQGEENKPEDIKPDSTAKALVEESIPTHTDDRTPGKRPSRTNKFEKPAKLEEKSVSNDTPKETKNGGKSKKSLDEESTPTIKADMTPSKRPSRTNRFEKEVEGEAKPLSKYTPKETKTVGRTNEENTPTKTEDTTPLKRPTRTNTLKKPIEGETVSTGTPKETKNGGKGKKSSIAGNRVTETGNKEQQKESQTETPQINSQVDLTDMIDTTAEEVHETSKKETKNGGQGKKALILVNQEKHFKEKQVDSTQQETKRSEQLKAFTTPLAKDKQLQEDASQIQQKVSPQQHGAAVMNILKSSKRKSRPDGETPPAKGTKPSERTDTKSKEVRETRGSESDTDPIIVKNSQTPHSENSPQVENIEDSKPETSARSKEIKNSVNGSSQSCTNNEIADSEKCITPRSGRLSRNRQGKPMDLDPPVTVTPDAKTPIQNGEGTPKRSKRRLDSILSTESGESVKKVKTTPQSMKPEASAKTPVTSEKNKLSKTPRTPRTPKIGFENEELNMKANIEKIKELQKQEISLIQREGTYVQCSRAECCLWRLVTEYHDPATVPDNWNCSMNPDPEARICGLGGEKVEDEETVDVEYTCGSMVWAKLKGFPSWPGMVDYCPDTQVPNINLPFIT